MSHGTITSRNSSGGACLPFRCSSQQWEFGRCLSGPSAHRRGRPVSSVVTCHWGFFNAGLATCSFVVSAALIFARPRTCSRSGRAPDTSLMLAMGSDDSMGAIVRCSADLFDRYRATKRFRIEASLTACCVAG